MTGATNKSAVERKVLAPSILLLMACFLSLLNTGSLEGQDKVVLTQEQWETGFHAFSQIMRKRGIQVHDEFESWEETPARDRILVLMGDVSEADQLLLDKFVSQGGSALLATDTSFGPTQIERHNVTINFGGRVGASRSSSRYRGIDGWPIIRRFDTNDPIFDGVSRIIPNYPALLIIPSLAEGTGWKTIATYPSLQGWGSNRPFIVKFESAQGGRLLMVPDHSLFVNGSVNVGDNLRFMLNTVDWLREGNRQHCLFVLNRVSTAPLNVSNVDLYTAPPGAAETRRMLRDLWRNTTTRDKLELANEALEFAQEEQLMEQIMDAVHLEDMIPPNQLMKWLLVFTAWLSVIAFVVVLVSNRKKPLDGNSADGLKLNEKKEIKRREKVERARAAEALFVHFFNRAGMAITRPQEVNADLIVCRGTEKEMKRLKKDVVRIRNDLARQPVDYWTDSRVEEVGRHIAQWANLSETGVLRIESPEIQMGDEFSGG